MKSPRDMATDARAASLKLRVLPSSERSELLEKIADAVEANQKSILEQNTIDVEKATGTIEDALMKRLQLKEGKLVSAVAGIRQIARSDEPLGKCLYKMQIMKGLVLEKVTVPIGVLLIIFEARPEALLQIAALAIRSGNGLLLKGGKEATQSNLLLHKIVTDTINTVLPSIGSGLISLVQTREEISDLLKLDDVIDLVIPRGSSQLVSFIQQNTKIAVLGHADGICHVYVDEDADLDSAIQTCLDSKIDYPAACNAVETILIHKSFLQNKGFESICAALQSHGVRLFKGRYPLLEEYPFDSAPDLRHEYSSLEVTVELVDDLDGAIHHINTYGSGHTDSIVTKNAACAEEFLARVDSSCVFHNASTRWSDGYRFGLGAEVGISTSRIHARGPVGVEGLMTTKFVLRGKGHLVSGDANKDAYLFKEMETEASSWTMCSLYFASGFGAAVALHVLYGLILTARNSLH